MKTFEEFMTENEKTNIFLPYKKIYSIMKEYRDSWVNRVTGKTVPASMNWRKSGGHAGAKTIAATIEKAVAMGFKEIDMKHNAVPDGSSVGNSTVYRNSDGFTLVASSSYGSTASKNHFSLTFYAPSA